MSRPRLVASDLDGTLLGVDGALSPRTSAVLSVLDGAGVPVVMVTGRPLRWLDDLLPATGRHGLAICSNGALVWDVAAEQPFLTRGMEPGLAAEVGRDLRAAVPGTTYAVERLEGIGLEPDFLERHRKPPGSQRASLAELLASTPEAGVLKLLARHEDLEPEAFWARGVEAVGERAVVTISTTRSALLEISAAGVTKASTLARVCEHLGVEPADVVAFGDMPNDVEMLTWAGRSWAMAEAHPSVREAADHTAPGHDDDGVAQVLEQLFDLPATRLEGPASGGRTGA